MIDDDKNKDDFSFDEEKNEEGAEAGPSTGSGYSEELEDRIQAFADSDISTDEALSRAASSKSEEQRARERKYILWGSITALILLILGGVYSCQPTEGSMAYGICSTLLETNTQYPETLKITEVEGSRTTVRIYFTSIDAFGQFKLEMFECKFGPDPNNDKGMRITELLRNRKSLGQEAISNANKILPAITSSNPYRVMPPEWKNQLLP